MAEEFCDVGRGVTLCYETFGDPADPPIVLVMGLATQMIAWDDELCRMLAERGFRVVRFDNRDVGLSSKIKGGSYTLDEMAGDARGLLEWLGVSSAHVVGASMGGMIAQLVAADFPERTLSLTSIMSSTGNPNLPRAPPEAMARLNTPAPNPNENLEAFLDHSVEGAQVMAGTYPVDAAKVREDALATFRRCYYPIGFQRQYAGIMASPDRRPKLKTITAPTVVIHGDADPLVPLAGGRDTAENIPGAELIIVPGVGHEMPLAVLDVFVDGILSAVARSKATAEAAE